MYLFQLEVKKVPEVGDYIYIPLCIYFNIRGWYDCTDWIQFTFHYVSISTASSAGPTIYNKKFTFHYVSISTTRTTDELSTDSIYIPLCIYFNIDKIDYAVDIPAFTFHYVSISTRSVTTFVYGCSHIYIPLCIYFNYTDSAHTASGYTHLHSTMYLFQRSVTTFVYGCSHIYIPLCIYFNREDEKSRL